MFTVAIMFCAIVPIVKAGDPPSWDLLNNPWDSLNGWGQYGAGTSEINPAGQHHQKPNSGTYIARWKDIGTLPDDYTGEFKLCVDNFGNGGYVDHEFYDGVHRYAIFIYAGKIKNPDSGTEISLTTDAGTWYTWRVVIDSSGHSFKVYRKPNGGSWSYIGNIGGGLNYTDGDGTVYYTSSNIAGQNGCEAHEDYLKIASGLYEPSLSTTYRIDLNLTTSVAFSKFLRTNFIVIVLPTVSISFNKVLRATLYVTTSFTSTINLMLRAGKYYFVSTIMNIIVLYHYIYPIGVGGAAPTSSGGMLLIGMTFGLIFGLLFVGMGLKRKESRERS